MDTRDEQDKTRATYSSIRSVAKTAERSALEEQIKEYLNSGKHITLVPRGVTNDAMGRMRMAQVVSPDRPDAEIVAKRAKGTTVAGRNRALEARIRDELDGRSPSG